jgi:hypothetical protein
MEVSRYLSTPRLASYLAETDGDAELVLALYHWNLQLAAAFQEVLAVVEVVIRNAMDEQLRQWNPTRGRDHLTGQLYPPEWTNLPAAPLVGLVGSALPQARGHARAALVKRGSHHPRHRAPVCHDDVLAQLSFSLWYKLLPPADSKKTGLQRLWATALVHAFPHVGTDPASQAHPAEDLVHGRHERLVKLRNRVAHMEPLLE